MDDPWDWDVDRVVQELCTSNRSWDPHYPSSCLPDLVEFEQALRENIVDGYGLLTATFPRDMRDLGLDQYKQRKWLQDGIYQLRLKSAKYVGLHSVNPQLPSPRVGSQFDPATLLQALPAKRKRAAEDDPSEFENKQARVSAAGDEEDAITDHATDEVIDTTGPGNQVTVENASADDVSQQLSGSHNSEQPSLGQTLSEPHLANRKQKRIAPTFVSALDPNRVPDRIPSAADHVKIYAAVEPNDVMTAPRTPNLRGQEEETDISMDIVTSDEEGTGTTSTDDVEAAATEQMEEKLTAHVSDVNPGTALDEQTSHKRIMPELQVNSSEERQPESGAAENETANIKSRKAEEHLAQGYLGKEKMLAEDIFYGKCLVDAEGVEDDEPGQFSIQARKISRGRRLYVNSMMKKFLLQNNAIQGCHRFSRDGQSYSAILPYPAYLVPDRDERFFTLLHTSDDGEVHASKAAVSEWPEADPETSLDGVATHGKSDMDWLDSLGHGPQLDLDALEERYKNLPGDTLLPYLDQSDTDDDDFWQEIEAENGTLVRSKRPSLTTEQVHAAIDEGIAALMEKWQTVVLPRLAHKEWPIYRKFRRLGKKARMFRKRQLEGDVSHLNDNRIPRVRSEILRDDWTSSRQVRRQTIGSLEVTILEREKALWELSVLRNKKPPLEPTPEQSRLRKEENFIADLPDALESRSRNASDDDLGSFIEEDDDLGSFIEEVDDQEVDDQEHEAAEAAEQDASSDWSDAEETQITKSLLSENDVEDQSDKAMEDLLPSHAPNASLSDTPEGREDVQDRQSTDQNMQVDELVDEEVQANESSDTLPPRTPTRIAPSKNPADLVDDGMPPPRGEVSSGKAPTSNLVDLTHLPDSPAPSRPRTPSRGPKEESRPWNTQESIDLTTPIKATQKRKSKGISEIIVLSSDSETNVPTPLPPHHETSQIASKLTYDVLERLGDRDRLVIKFLHTLQPEIRSKLLAEFEKLDMPILWTSFKDVLHSMLYNALDIAGWEVGKFDTYLVIVRMFQMFVQCKFRHTIVKKQEGWSGISMQFVESLEKEGSLFSVLYERVRRFAKTVENVKYTEDAEDDDDDEDDEEPLVSRRSMISPRSEPSGSDDDLTPALIPTKKKKRKIVKNAEAVELRESHKLRAEQLRQRREVLQKKIASSDKSILSDPSNMIINDGKTADEGYVYVHESIRSRIKTHQIDGVRFMWEQIVTDHKTMQGCLLAHTMGLGKTMQVITLLIAIQEAARSKDESVSKQIPPSLRSEMIRTLVLCPPTIIDNWEDELLKWAPGNTLGDPFKVNAHMGNVHARMVTIETWFSKGGVLIMGYEMFRNMLSNRASKGKDAPLSAEALETLRKQLLDGPSLIIADEAHKLKNAKSKASVFASQFTSTSRIALTGSPLNNSVQEYFTMVDWVAPNYLGPLTEFKATYQEPIEAGLWAESTPSAKRLSQKRLKVLIKELELKVNRATMQELKDDLPPKREFVFRVALTSRQKEMYISYVRHMSRSKVLDIVDLTKAGDISQTTLWSWLAILSLLCNHPGLFRDKLAALTNAKQRQAQRAITGNFSKKSTPASDDDDEHFAGDEEMTSIGTAISQAGWGQNMMKHLDSIEDLMSPSLSNKVQILVRILDESRAVKDKVLVFSQSIPTLDYFERLCRATGRKFFRLDGKTKMNERQGMTKEFNEGVVDIFIISTKAGGLGLNLPAANRVVIFDFKYNPTQEEQAIGRAYRIGQVKPVFVYRFVAAGTFETKIHNKAVYKTQLASRVVDKENPLAWARKTAAEYLAEPEDVDQEDLTIFEGEDDVLDKILHDEASASVIRSILKTDTFAEADDEALTKEDEEEIQRDIVQAQLKRTNPQEYEERKQANRTQQSGINGRSMYDEAAEVQTRGVYTPTANPPRTPIPGYTLSPLPHTRQPTDVVIRAACQANREERLLHPITGGFTSQPSEVPGPPSQPAKPSPSPEKSPTDRRNQSGSGSLFLGQDAAARKTQASPGQPKAVTGSLFKSSSSRPAGQSEIATAQATAAKSDNMTSAVSGSGAADTNLGYFHGLMNKLQRGPKN